MINIVEISDTDTGWVWEVWTDTGDGIRDGRCLAVGASREEAVADAVKALEADLNQILGGFAKQSKA